MTIIKLNVGGQVFSTRETTLKSRQNFFEVLLASENAERDENGVLFIDRSPVHFHYVLNYLREGQLQPKLSEETLAGIRKEAEYYEMGDLVNYIHNIQLSFARPLYDYHTAYYTPGSLLAKASWHSSNPHLANLLAGIPQEAATKRLIDSGYEIVDANIVVQQKIFFVHVITVRIKVASVFA
jgi:hypothetical protein